MTVYVQGKAQKAPERTLSLHLSLIFSTETVYSYQKKEITKKVEGQNLISMDTMLLDSNGRCSTKNHKVYIETERYCPFRRKRINQQKLSLKRN